MLTYQCSRHRSRVKTSTSITATELETQVHPHFIINHVRPRPLSDRSSSNDLGPSWPIDCRLSIVDCWYFCPLWRSIANQYVKIYTLAAAGNFPYLVVSKNAIKGQKVAIKSWISSLKLARLGRDSSTDSCCDYKEDEASGGERELSFTCKT